MGLVKLSDIEGVWVVSMEGKRFKQPLELKARLVLRQLEAG